MFSMTLTDEQLDLQKLVRDFTRKKITPVAEKLDEGKEFPWDLYKEVFDMGLTCINAPEEFGGPGLDLLTSAVIMEEFAKGDVGFAMTVNQNCLASHPVLLAGTAAQKKLFFDMANQGKLASFCLTEPSAGSDAAGVTTTAKREGDEYVINGAKCFITCGGVADMYTVVASTDRSKGAKGLTLFMVERDRPGISIGKKEDKMGIRSSETREVIFENVRIPVANRLGQEGEGMKIAMETLDAARPMAAIMAVGIGQAAIDHCVRYAKQREQFGKPIASFQGVQFMLADMDIQVEASRNMVYKACNLHDEGKPFSRESAICKTFATDTAMKVAVDAVQIFGGYGYSKEYPVEKLMRDAKILQIVEGTNQIQRIVIARNLLA